MEGECVVVYQSFTCQPYLDQDGRFPSGPPIVVSAADKTTAIIRATEHAIKSGIDWAVIVVNLEDSALRNDLKQRPRRR